MTVVKLRCQAGIKKNKGNSLEPYQEPIHTEEIVLSLQHVSEKFSATASEAGLLSQFATEFMLVVQKQATANDLKFSPNIMFLST